MISDITIVVTGPDKSGKGYIISAINQVLTEMGAAVSVQCAETHNKKKLEKDADEIRAKLSDKRVVIMEQQIG